MAAIILAMKYICKVLFILVLVIGLGCGTPLVDKSGDGSSDNTTALPLEEAVAAWLNGWESGSATALINHEIEMFLGLPSVQREAAYNEDFQISNYTITDEQITVESHNETSAEILATFHIKIVEVDGQLVLEQDNSWRFILVKDDSEWLISSYENISAS